MGFCAGTANLWQFVGYFLLIFKIVIPLILIILGMLDLGKAVTSSDEKAIQKATKSLLNRAIAAVAIFFVPTLIGLLLDIVYGFSEIRSDYTWCKNCLVSPTSSCDTHCVGVENPAACAGINTDVDE